MYDPLCSCQDCEKHRELLDIIEEPKWNKKFGEKTPDGNLEWTNLGPLVESGTNSRPKNPPFLVYDFPWEVDGLASWVYHRWNYCFGWDGPTIQLRDVGFRLFGFSFSWVKKWRGVK